MRKSSVPADYRGRDKMTLTEFIEDVEKCHFRTAGDTGANSNALFVWNIVRNWAGLDCLEKDDLIQRHADSLGWTFEETKADYEALKEWKRKRANGEV